MIYCVSVGPISENAYIITQKSGPVILVDPGAEAERLYAAVRKNAGNASYLVVIMTHGHLDHIAALQGLLDAAHADGLRCISYAPCGDKIYFGQDARPVHERIFSDIGAAAFFKKQWTDIPEADEYYEDGFVFPDTNIRVIHTPGHTHGSSCFLVEDDFALISGDTLFRAGRGRTDNFDSDENRIMQSIHKKLFVLPDDLRVYPGHGADTTIGSERMCYL